MDKALSMQMQIRQNAEELSTTLSDMSSWEKKMKEKDTRLRHGKPVTTPRERKVTREGGTVQLKSTTSNKIVQSTSPSIPLNPASMVDSVVNNDASSSSTRAVTVPSARGRYEQRDLEEVEREAGNAEFKAGNFAAAVKCYTKCLGLKSNNYVAFSNRAMAYLKLKDYLRAAIDCDCALKIEPTHVKSLLRRATAFNALGKHRAALFDLFTAQELEPSNKQVRSDMAQTKEMLRASVNRAPHSTLRSYDELLALHEQHRQEKVKEENTQGRIDSVDLSSPTNIMTIEDAEDGVVQGPDPMPASFLIPSHSTNENPSFTENGETLNIKNINKPVSSLANEYDSSVRIPISLAGDDDEDSGDDKHQEENNSQQRPFRPQEEPRDEVGSSMHRIVIVDDASPSDDDQNTKQTKQINTIPVTSSPITIAISEKDTATMGTKMKMISSSSASTTTKVKSPSKKSQMKASSSSLKGAYELEKALIQVQGDILAMQQLLLTLQPAKDASRIFQTVVEPDAMMLLLDSLWQVIQTTDMENQVPSETFWQWCYALQGLSSFSFLYSLVARDAKQVLQERLRQLQAQAPWQGHSKKMSLIVSKFC